MKKLTLTIMLIISAILSSCGNYNLEFEQVKGPINNEPTKNEPKTLYYKENSSINLPQNDENSSDYIIPNSDKKKVTTEILDKLSKADIALARNEIYARHGYIFKSKKYKDYFNKHSWYVGNSDFSENDFSKIENDNLKIIDNYLNSIEKFTTLMTNNYGKYDLNSDGNLEEISVEFKDGSTKYELTIGKAKVTQKGGSNFSSVVLYDVNSNDEFKEIAIVDEIENDTYFYYYNGGKIISMGNVPGTNESIKINGSGQVLTEKKGSILGLQDWSYPIQYSLNEVRALMKNSTVKYYEMDYEVTLKRDLTLCVSPSNNKKLITLKKDAPVKLTRSDDFEWCEVETSVGEKGWFKVENNVKINGKYVSGFFDGIDTSKTQ